MRAFQAKNKFYVAYVRTTYFLYKRTTYLYRSRRYIANYTSLVNEGPLPEQFQENVDLLGSPVMSII